MGYIKSLDIVFHNHLGDIYLAGQTIQGHVHVSIEGDRLKLKGDSLLFHLLCFYITLSCVMSMCNFMGIFRKFV